MNHPLCSFFEDCFGCTSPLRSHMNFRIKKDKKRFIAVWIGVTLNSWITLGNIVIFTILSLPTHGHGMSLRLFVSFSKSLSSVL